MSNEAQAPALGQHLARPGTGMMRQRLSYPALHGLRGYLALWVLLGHLVGEHGFFQIPQHSNLAVDVFFIMSGFILMETHHDDFRVIHARSVLRFLSLRFWRTMPVLLFAAAFALALSGFLFGFWPAFSQFVKSVLFIDTWEAPSIHHPLNGPTWSLRVEWFGYFAFPLICAALISVRSTRFILIMMCAIILCETFFLAVTGNGSMDAFQGPGSWIRMAGGFPIGCTLWCVLRVQTFRLGLSDRLMAATVVALIAVLYLLQPAFSVGCLTMIVALATRPGPVTGWILENRLAKYFGEISYSLYLTHYPIVRACEYIQHQFKTNLPSAIFSTSAIIISLSLATVICLTVEKPARRYGRKLTDSFLGRIEPQLQFTEPMPLNEQEVA